MPNSKGPEHIHTEEEMQALFAQCLPWYQNLLNSDKRFSYPGYYPYLEDSDLRKTLTDLGFHVFTLSELVDFAQDQNTPFLLIPILQAEAVGTLWKEGIVVFPTSCDDLKHRQEKFVLIRNSTSIKYNPQSQTVTARPHMESTWHTLAITEPHGGFRLERHMYPGQRQFSSSFCRKNPSEYCFIVAPLPEIDTGPLGQ